MTIDLFNYDISQGVTFLAGVDEAGRGPLAGPVVTACCMMPLDEMIDGINDSKKVAEKKREKLFDEICKRAVYSISIVDHEIIDEINILQATKNAMTECVNNMAVKPELVLLDAVKLNLNCPSKAIIKGDATSYNIAAASILAKVTRDRIMLELDQKYPQYGFAKHKGYGTKAHIEAIKKYGPCPVHRRTFIKNFVGENND